MMNPKRSGIDVAPLDNGELASGEFRSLASLYASGCLFSTTLTAESGNNFLFSYMHIAFVVSVLILFFSRNFLSGILIPVAISWPYRFLFLFLFYFLLMALVHPDPEVSQGYTRAFFTTVVPGLLMGYVAFATYGGVRHFRPLAGHRRWRPGWLRVLCDLLAVAVYLGTISASWQHLMPLLQKDIFIINVPNEQRVYQIFGDYIFLSFVLFHLVLVPYFDYRYQKSVLAMCIWAVTLTATTIFSFLLAQMVGSNTGAAIVVALGVALGCYRFVSELRKHTARSRLRACIILLAAIVSIACLGQFLMYQPPLRILNFQRF